MGRSQETFGKKEVRNKKAKKKKDKEAKKMAKKEAGKSSWDDMIAYVDENGVITDTPPDPTVKKVEVNIEDIQIGAAAREPEDELDPIRTGIVTYYNDQKGYGFIKDVETQESVFVHVNELKEEVVENNKVTYEVEMGMKGPVAVRVSIVRS
ncbi:MAG: cold shock CspA family protein [Bacteroidia bacterium]|jgi:cold shock CspA family protein